MLTVSTLPGTLGSGYIQGQYTGEVPVNKKHTTVGRVNFVKIEFRKSSSGQMIDFRHEFNATPSFYIFGQ